MSSQGLTRRRTLLLGSLRSAGQQHRRATMVDVCPVLEPGMEAVPTNADSHSHALSLLSSANASVDGGVSAPKDDAEVLQLEDSRNESKPAQDNPNQPFLQRHLFTEKQRARAAAIVAEVFRFDPTDLVDDFYNAVQVTVATVLDAFEAFVLESVAEVAFDSTAAEDAAEMGLMQACTLMEHAVDKTFDKLEVYVLDNIFKVPSNVCITMSQYEGVDTNLLHESEPEMDARLEDLRRHIAKAKIIKETLESSLFLLSHHTAALTRLYAALPHATPAVASHSNDLEPLHALVREMDSDSRDAGGLLAAAAARAGGVVPFKTDSHTRELADVMLAYRQRMADAVGGGMVGSGMVGGDVERFLKGMKAAGVASVEEMQVAREVAGVPEALAEVGWGSYTGPEDDTTLVTQMIVD